MKRSVFDKIENNFTGVRITPNALVTGVDDEHKRIDVFFDNLLVGMGIPGNDFQEVIDFCVRLGFRFLQVTNGIAQIDFRGHQDIDFKDVTLFTESLHLCQWQKGDSYNITLKRANVWASKFIVDSTHAISSWEHYYYRVILKNCSLHLKDWLCRHGASTPSWVLERDTKSTIQVGKKMENRLMINI